MNRMRIVPIVTLSVASCAAPAELDAPSIEGWVPETFQLPPAFAPELPPGEESVLFPPVRLDPSLYSTAGAEQEARRVEDPFLQTLSDVLTGVEGKLRAEDAWAIVGVPSGQRTSAHNARLGDAMRELGWRRRRLRFGGNPEYAYTRGDPSIRLEVVIGPDGKVQDVRRAGVATDLLT